MPTFKLPDIGEGVQEGEIVKWNVKEGDSVKKDDIIVEIMTDKVTVQIPSPFEGKVTKIYYEEGQVAQVGTALLDIGKGDISSLREEETKKSEEMKEEVKTVSSASSENKVLAPPGVRRLAKEKGVDLASIKGTGPHGRITLSDLQEFLKDGMKHQVTKSAPKFTQDRTVLELKGLRRLISEKMTKSKQQIPHYSVAEEVSMENLISLREKLKEGGTSLSFTPFFVRASVLALKEFPYFNARSIEDGKFEILGFYNIGIAVDTKDGLTVVVIKDADKKSVSEISSMIAELAQKARDGKLVLDEVKDSTFTVTNVGSIGGIFSTPIINYPEVAILGVHRIRDVQSGRKMFITLSADHRLIDGAMAARFITRVKRYLEEPVNMLV